MTSGLGSQLAAESQTNPEVLITAGLSCCLETPSTSWALKRRCAVAPAPSIGSSCKWLATKRDMASHEEKLYK